MANKIVNTAKTAAVKKAKAVKKDRVKKAKASVKSAKADLKAQRKEVIEKYKNNKPVAPDRKLYTDEEREQLKMLREKRTKYKRQLKELLKVNSISLKWVRGFISEDTARELYYAGYFDSENYESYQSRDFRDWMIEQGDTGLMEQVASEVSALAPQEISSDFSDLTDKISNLEKEIENIRSSAKERKDFKRLKYEVELLKNKINKKEELDALDKMIDRSDTKMSLIDLIDQGPEAIAKINAVASTDEKQALELLKKRLAKGIVNNIDFSLEGMTDTDVKNAESALYTSIVNNPKAGIKQFIFNEVKDYAITNYGEGADSIVQGIIEMATGKGNPALSLFNGAVGLKGFGKATLQSKADELIDSGESTEEVENAKMFRRDMIVDIAKNVIMSGGNIYAAIPGILKDTFLNVGKKVANDNKENTIKTSTKKQAESLAKNKKIPVEMAESMIYTYKDYLEMQVEDVAKTKQMPYDKAKGLITTPLDIENLQVRKHEIEKIAKEFGITPREVATILRAFYNM